MYLEISNPMDYHVALYIRLSKEDETEGPSQSVTNQKSLLNEFVQQHRLSVYDTYVDDGWSGTSFDRPDFQRMIEDIEAKKVNMVITKDLSRLGRDYIMTGHYMERYFPEKRVRYISLLDGIDTGVESTANDITPFRAIMNDMYAKDISKKIKSVKRDKQRKGQFIGGKPMYGYKMHPTEKNEIVIDEEVAPVVRRIFAMALDGMSCRKIAATLNEEGVPTPATYCGWNMGRKGPYAGLWSSERISEMLQNETYLGNMVQGRTVKISYKSKKCLKQDRENWVVVENTHEPLIDRETFDKVQALAQRRNEEYFEALGRFTHLETTENILKGLVYCADCKRPLVRYKNVSHEKKLWYTFICPTHANDIGSCPLKNIREDALFPMLLQAIQTQIALAADMEAIVRRLNSSPKYRKQTATLQGRLDAAKRALKRCNGLYDSLYQSYVDQLMTEQEYMTLKRRYKAEAEEAERLIETLTRRQAAEAAHTSENPFLAAFGSFRGADVLTKEMAQALIERVYVDGDSNIEIVFRYRDEYKELCTYLEGRKTDA